MNYVCARCDEPCTPSVKLDIDRTGWVESDCCGKQVLVKYHVFLWPLTDTQEDAMVEAAWQEADVLKAEMKAGL
jgi:hypothetical protein